MVTLHGITQNINNEAFLWKIAVLEKEKPPIGAGLREHLVPRPCWLFCIPPFRKTFTAWRNVKCQHGRETKCSHTNRGLFHSQNCHFPEESFILISFCYSLACEMSGISLPISILKYLYIVVQDTRIFMCRPHMKWPGYSHM
jgi:hypothetical protein